MRFDITNFVFCQQSYRFIDYKPNCNWLAHVPSINSNCQKTKAIRILSKKVLNCEFDIQNFIETFSHANNIIVHWFINNLRWSYELVAVNLSEWKFRTVLESKFDIKQCSFSNRSRISAGQLKSFRTQTLAFCFCF